MSGRGWKLPGTRAGALKNPHLSTSWEKKMADKAEAKLFKDQKTAASDEHKSKISVQCPITSNFRLQTQSPPQHITSPVPLLVVAADPTPWFRSCRLVARTDRVQASVRVQEVHRCPMMYKISIVEGPFCGKLASARAPGSVFHHPPSPCFIPPHSLDPRIPLPGRRPYEAQGL